MIPLKDAVFWITGATGRLGCEATARLEDLGATVFPLVLDGYPELPKRVPWKSLIRPKLIRGLEDLEQLPFPNVTLNLHWRVDRTRSFSEQLLDELDFNLHRPAFLWEWLRKGGCECFINVSSVKVFSRLNSNPISGDSEPRPATPYGIAKLAGEKFFDALFAGTQTRVVHVRPSTVASMGEHPAQLMSQLYESAFHQKEIWINTGHVTFLLYIDEAVDLIIGAAEMAEAGRYNIVPDGMLNEEIAGLFEETSGLQLKADYVDRAPGVHDRVYDSEILKLRTPWTRTTPLPSLIHKILELRRSDDGQWVDGPVKVRADSPP